MKKLISVLIVMVVLLTVLCICPVTVTAEENTYSLPELDLEIKIPSEYTVITRDTPANDPVFNSIGVSADLLLPYFKANNIYLNALPSVTNEEEIVVTMTLNGMIDSFSQFQDVELMAIIAGMKDEYEALGYEVLDFRTITYGQTKYIWMHFCDAAKTVYGDQYSTIYNGKAMNFTLRSYAGDVTPQQRVLLRDMISSIHYTTGPQPTQPSVTQPSTTPQKTDPFVYTDAETGVSFTVPANWTGPKDVVGSVFQDVKFSFTGDPAVTVGYQCFDIWKYLINRHDEYSRAEMDNSVFSPSDIMDMSFHEGDRISYAAYGGRQYFRVDAKDGTIYLIRFQNGYRYSFVFKGTEESSAYNDFEELVGSAQSPEVETQPETTPTTGPTATGATKPAATVMTQPASVGKDEKGMDSSTAGTIMWSLLAGLAVSVGAFVVVRICKSKE